MASNDFIDNFICKFIVNLLVWDSLFLLIIDHESEI